jgi:hypothetical protein
MILYGRPASPMIKYWLASYTLANFCSRLWYHYQWTVASMTAHKTFLSALMHLSQQSPTNKQQVHETDHMHRCAFRITWICKYYQGISHRVCDTPWFLIFSLFQMPRHRQCRLRKCLHMLVWPSPPYHGISSWNSDSTAESISYYVVLKRNLLHLCGKCRDGNLINLASTSKNQACNGKDNSAPRHMLCSFNLFGDTPLWRSHTHGKLRIPRCRGKLAS